MRALRYEADRKAPRLWIDEVAPPALHPGEVRIDVAASAINRADLLQVRGLYPAPAGESEIPGLECAGTIVELGEGVSRWKCGDRVMALLAGGGHAEQVVAPVGQLLRLPKSLELEEGAAIPEVAITAWTNLVREGEMEPGEAVLITAAASGVGTFAVQLAFELGARVFVAGRKRDRLEELRRFGADLCLPLGEEMPRAIHRANGGEGVDLVIDLVGGEGFRHALASLRNGGRLVLVGILGGGNARVDLGEILRRRLVIRGSVLRSRSRQEKADLVDGFCQVAWSRLRDGRLRAVVDRVLPFEALPEAYRVLGEEEVLGKVVVSRAG
jgi:putative PIG3 family NAD(P)H quinone oxidoreductase